MRLPPPYEDVLTGACVQVAGRGVLVAGDGWELAASRIGEVLLSGELALRYAVPLLHAQDALIPQLIFDDYRREHTGLDSYRFVVKSGRAFPRADAIGTLESGEAVELRLRELDIAVPFHVLAYERNMMDGPPERLHAVAMVSSDFEGAAAILLDEPHDLPVLLVENVPCFRTGSMHVSDVSKLLDGLQP